MFDATILEQFLWFSKNHDKRNDYTAAQIPILCRDLFGWIAGALNERARLNNILHTQHQEIARLAGVLDRLGSSEAFVVSRVISPVLDAELLARMQFARDAIAVAASSKIIRPN